MILTVYVGRHKLPDQHSNTNSMQQAKFLTSDGKLRIGPRNAQVAAEVWLRSFQKYLGTEQMMAN